MYHPRVFRQNVRDVLTLVEVKTPQTSGIGDD